ncbi:MAG: hypothetical protein ACT4NL_11860 [Pseudomarimonas sp.]
MQPASIFLSVALAMLTAGCSDSPAPADPSAPLANGDSTVSEPLPAAAPAIDGHELERAIQDPLDRARAMEGEILKAADEADKAMEDQGD